MKALFVSNDPAIFDAQSAVRERMYVYAAEIGELHLLSPARRGAQETHEGALHLHPVHVPRILRIPVMRVRARHIVKKYGIEVVSAQDPFELGLIALSARRKTAAVLHVQVHTDFLSPWFVRSGSWSMSLRNWVRVRIAGHVLRRARGIRVVSERIRGSMRERYRGTVREPAVIPVAVSLAVPEAKPLPAHAFSFALICVGRLEPEKRIEDIFDALAHIKPQRRSIGLFVVGSGRERARLEARASTLGLSGSVVFLGHQAADARALMGCAQAFIQASAYEGYGRTFVEAALAGTPIITTDVGIVGEVLHDGVEALVAPVHKPRVLAEHIERLFEDNHARIELAAAARAAVEAHLKKEGDLPRRIAADLGACLGL